MSVDKRKVRYLCIHCLIIMPLDWTADVWVTRVYRPGRSHKLLDIRLQHTMQMGMRYEKHRRFYQLHLLMTDHKNMIARYEY